MVRLELPISDVILEAVGLSPDPNLDIMSRLWEAAPASSIVVSALTTGNPTLLSENNEAAPASSTVVSALTTGNPTLLSENNAE